MTYNVFGGTLNLALSVYLFQLIIRFDLMQTWRNKPAPVHV